MAPEPAGEIGLLRFSPEAAPLPEILPEATEWPLLAEVPVEPPEAVPPSAPALLPGSTEERVFGPEWGPRPHTPGRVPAAAIPPEWCDEEGYPYRDGTAMGERHHDQQVYAVSALRARYAGDPERAHVGGELNFYYEEGNRNASVRPDVFVAFGAPHLPRLLTWKLWREHRGPDWVLEVLSKSTRHRDEVYKPAIYLALGVREYWLFDPDAGENGKPWLRGMRNAGREWRFLAPDAAGALRSDLLGLDLYAEDGDLRFRDAATGEKLMSLEENVAALNTEIQARRAEQEAHWSTQRQLAAAEARIAELEAALRGK